MFPSQLNSRGTAVGMILYLKNDKAIKCIKNLKMYVRKLVYEKQIMSKIVENNVYFLKITIKLSENNKIEPIRNFLKSKFQQTTKIQVKKINLL